MAVTAIKLARYLNQSCTDQLQIELEIARIIVKLMTIKASDYHSKSTIETHYTDDILDAITLTLGGHINKVSRSHSNSDVSGIITKRKVGESEESYLNWNTGSNSSTTVSNLNNSDYGQLAQLLDPLNVINEVASSKYQGSITVITGTRH